MYVLGIETSGEQGGFAVVNDGKVVCEIIANMHGAHVEKGSTLIEDSLKMASITVGDLDGVAVSLGPGSFTGLRVGLALAKGLCFGTGARLLGVPSLDAIAEMLRMWQGLVVPMRDARRGEVYFSVYRSDGAAIERLTDYMALPPESAGSMIGDLSQDATILVAGDAIARYGELLRKEFGDRLVFAQPTYWMPKPAIVAELGLRMLKAGSWLKVDEAEPLYVRPSEAERNRQRHKSWQDSR